MSRRRKHGCSRAVISRSGRSWIVISRFKHEARAVEGSIPSDGGEGDAKNEPRPVRQNFVPFCAIFVPWNFGHKVVMFV